MTYKPDLESVFAAIVLYVRCTTPAIGGLGLRHEFEINQQPLTLLIDENSGAIKISGDDLQVIEKKDANGMPEYKFRKGSEDNIRALSANLHSSL